MRINDKNGSRKRVKAQFSTSSQQLMRTSLLLRRLTGIFKCWQSGKLGKIVASLSFELRDSDTATTVNIYIYVLKHPAFFLL